MGLFRDVQSRVLRVVQSRAVFHPQTHNLTNCYVRGWVGVAVTMLYVPLGVVIMLSVGAFERCDHGVILCPWPCPMSVLAVVCLALI